MHAAEAFFGRKPLPFTVVRIVSGEPDVSRTYARFRDVIADAIDARVFQGIQFRASDEQGAGIGKRVARWLDRHFFPPAD